MEIKPILSVGIDVGTTSTHLTISRLHLANVARVSEPSKLVIDRREIVYQSRVYFTPLTADGCIDGTGVLEFLRHEYEQAGLTTDDIDTGAVIITGESASMRNAQAVGESLSQLAGKFVVASAGPNLEGILAGRGSGAAQASKQEQRVICNIDIGGGTTNAAIFDSGDIKGTSALAVGGRFIRLNAEFEVLHVSESGKYICRQVLGHELQIGTRISLQTAKELADFAALTIFETMVIGTGAKIPLLITEPSQNQGTVDEYWFSGGVAELMLDGVAASDTEYGDMGVLLGRALLQLCRQRNVSCTISEKPIRATVIGAGIFSLQLSGSTVAVASGALPITNLPIVRLTIPNAMPDQIAEMIEGQLGRALAHYDLNWTERSIALFIPGLKPTGYLELQKWAEALRDVFRRLNGRQPLVVICAFDIAAALGQSLKKLMPAELYVVLDGIHDTGYGDYIDIGEPIANGQSIPVVLKDLVFGN